MRDLSMIVTFSRDHSIIVVPKAAKTCPQTIANYELRKGNNSKHSVFRIFSEKNKAQISGVLRNIGTVRTFRDFATNFSVFTHSLFQRPKVIPLYQYRRMSCWFRVKLTEVGYDD